MAVPLAGNRIRLTIGSVGPFPTGARVAGGPVGGKLLPLLERGDTVAVVSPGFAVRRRPLAAGLAALRRMGFRVVTGEHVLDRAGYLAGSDEQRAADLDAVIRDAGVDAIWFARGGYGAARLLERVDWRALRRSGKPLIGYSDVTALFAAALSRTACPCLYGPVVSELGDPAAFHRPSLRAALRGEALTQRLRPRQVLAPGRARGPLAGGNLTVLSHLWGTRWAPDLRDAVLFLEDVGEETYRLDRMLTQLRSTGALARVRGVLLGGLVPAPRRRFPPDRDLGELLRETFLPLGVPVVTGLPAGHVRHKRTLPLGGRTEIDTAARRVRFHPATG